MAKKTENEDGLRLWRDSGVGSGVSDYRAWVLLVLLGAEGHGECRALLRPAKSTSRSI